MSPGCVSLIKSAKYSRLGLPTVNACSIYIHIYFNEKHNPWGFEERLLCVIQTIDSPSAPPPYSLPFLKRLFGCFFVWWGQTRCMMKGLVIRAVYFWEVLGRHRRSCVCACYLYHVHIAVERTQSSPSPMSYERAAVEIKRGFKVPQAHARGVLCFLSHFVFSSMCVCV